MSAAPGRLGRTLQRLRRGAARLPARLVAFNLLLVLVPLGGAFYFGLHELLGRYERHLLDAQERSMAQQGRLLAAALAEPVEAAARAGGEGGAAGGPREPRELSAEGAQQILAGLEQRITARLRVWDRDGRLLADSSRLGPRRDQLEAGAAGAEGAPEAADREDSWLYRLGAAPFRLW
ncbi:MAG TPA: stimulus-sensing domain-containing protein, partial [Thermoanaerobaculia bacterium]|nr:stimulus-sensing domain-containing protein [Thermoanaerobaculia bacterium]